MPELPLGQGKVVLGMVHLRPLPGTPFYGGESIEQIMNEAVGSARALCEGGASGCLVQTVDRVYSADADDDPARTAAMSLIVRAVVEATSEDFHVGVQIMRNALKSSLAVARMAGASFIRAGALVGMTLTPHGLVEASPFEVMEYRAKIGAWPVKILADIASSHFAWLGGKAEVGKVARWAANVGADAVVVGDPDENRACELVAEVRAASPGLPVVLAGHTSHDNAARLLASADGAFVGTCLERGGWGGQIDPEKVRAYMDIVRGLGAHG